MRTSLFAYNCSIELLALVALYNYFCYDALVKLSPDPPEIANHDVKHDVLRMLEN
jgi:hypothetical protein